MVSQTVFADDRGHFRLETELRGPLGLRARMPPSADGVSNLHIENRNSKVNQRFSLKPLVDQVQLMAVDPSGEHYQQQMKRLKQG